MRLLITLGPKLEQQVVISIGLTRLSPHMGQKKMIVFKIKLSIQKFRIKVRKIQNICKLIITMWTTHTYYNGHFHIESSLLFLPQCLNIIQIEPPPSCSYLITRAPLLPQVPKAYRMHSFTSAMSNFNYCSLVRNFSSSQSLNKIENLQKRA